MTRRIKRYKDFEISLQIKDSTFIRPPRDTQRNWLLNGVLAEFSDNLNALNRLASHFVRGQNSIATDERSQTDLADSDIMEDWQIPIMQAMAKLATEDSGDLLEIGFGRGVASEFIQQQGVASHTIIECNDFIVARFEQWKRRYPDRDIRMAQGMWQDVLNDLGLFDAIFFHTYPLNETEFVEQIGNSVTFAAHFFPHAAKHLKPGGCFTYLSNEMDSLGRGHQRALLRHFSSIQIEILSGLQLPDQVNDAWWSDRMVLVKAVK